MLRSVISFSALLALLPYVACALVPVKHADTNSLAARDAQIRSALKPRSLLTSTYMDETYGPNFAISVTHAHPELRYVSLDAVEGFGVELSCKQSGDTRTARSSSLTLSFSQGEDLAAVEELWGNGSGMIFSTTHPECDASGVTSYFSAQRTHFNSEVSIVIMDGQVSPLSEHNAKGSVITVDGAPTRGFTYRHARRQSSPEPMSYNGTIDLQTPFSQPSAPLFTSPEFNVTCVNCSLTGQVFPAFSLTINNDTAAINNSFSADNFTNTGDVIQDVSLSTVVTEPIAANMTLEISSIEGISAHCSIPGICNVTAQYPGKSNSGFGQGLLSATPFTIAGISFAPNISWGLRLDLEVTAQTTFTIPFNTFVARDESASVGLHNPEQSTINPSFDLLPPSLSVGSVNACATVAYGPQASLTLMDNSETLFSLGGEVDLPKIELCLSQADNVDAQCTPNGSIAEAIQVDATVSAGATLNANALSIFKEDIGNEFDPTLLFRQECFPFKAPDAITGQDPSLSGISAIPSTNTSTTANSTSGTPYTPTSAPLPTYSGLATALNPSSTAGWLMFLTACIMAMSV